MHAIRVIGFRLALLPAMAGVSGCLTPNEYQPPPPPPVTVASPVVQDVTIFLEENGETESAHRAEVRSRVQGFLQETRFQPGAEVNEGDVLYVIEQIQYEAILNSAKALQVGAEAARGAAEAEITVAKAAIAAAEADANARQQDFRRADRLLPDGVVTQSEWDQVKAERDSAAAALDATRARLHTATAKLRQAGADIKKAEADVNQAQINLDYTLVKAPISGRITKTDVTRGNLVQNGTLLATVVDDETIWANFSISERDLLEMQRSDPKPADFDITTVKAYLQRVGDEGYPYEGHLDYVDPEVDQGTGTLAVRAVFENVPERPRILPGLFVRVRVPVARLNEAILIPELAVGRDQSGAYLLTVGADNVAQRKNVSLGNRQGELIVVTSGLQATDAIIVAGLQRARPGAEVTPQQSPPVTTPPVESQANSSARP